MAEEGCDKMKITKRQLRRIIKESLMDRAAAMHDTLQDIAWWMEEHGIYDGEQGVTAWIEVGDEPIDPSTESALRDQIEDYIK